MRDAVQLPIVVDVAVHPDGRGVAYLLRQADLDRSQFEYQLWWVTPGTPPRHLTDGLSYARDLHFSPDGDLLACLAAGHSGLPQVWVASLAADAPRQLTDAYGGVRQFRWLPSSDGIMYLALSHDGQAQLRRWDQRSRDDAYEHPAGLYPRAIWTAALTGAPPEERYAGDPGIEECAVSPDGARVVYATNETGLVEDDHRFDLWLLDLASGRTQQLTQRTGGARTPAWSPDGRQIAFRAPHDSRHTFSQSDVYRLNVTGGEPVNVTGERIGDALQHAWLSDDALLVATAVGTETFITRVGGAQPSPIAVGGRFSLAPGGRWLAYLTEGRRHLPEVVLHDLRVGHSQTLTAHTDVLAEFDLPDTQVIDWLGAGGLRIEGLLTLPHTSPPGLLPLIAFLHGGPHGRAYAAFHPFQNLRLAVLAAHGYAVLRPNFHGSAGYGNVFATALYQRIGDLDYRDIMAGVDALIARGVADPERLGVTGASYGGYLTNWIIGHTQRFKAAVTLAGVWDLVGDYGNTEEDLWQIDYCGSYYWEEPERYRRLSPSSYVQHIATPVLILHGDDDRNVPINNAREMWHALYHRGQVVSFVRYPREGHGEPEPLHQIDQVQRMLSWFDRHLRRRDGNGTSAAARP
jgi:dipeptidyl aminopeptidase/acylaminoacyl peptidase